MVSYFRGNKVSHVRGRPRSILAKRAGNQQASRPCFSEPKGFAEISERIVALFPEELSEVLKLLDELE